MKHLPLREMEAKVSKSIARQFFDECYEFTQEFIAKNVPDLIPVWPPSNRLPQHEYSFTPEGAVIHLSNSPSLLNTLRLQTQHVYTSHFVIASGNTISIPKRYELIRSLQSPVFMPHQIDEAIQHSWYASTIAWGIELRNCGIIRPYNRNDKPNPLTKTEENDHNFRRFEESSSYYWNRNMWTERFIGPLYSWKGYKYEIPTINQMESLAIVLRMLDVIVDGLNKDMILPANCINGNFPILPIIEWTKLRKCGVWEMRINEAGTVNPAAWLKRFPRFKNKFELEPIEDENESTISAQINNCRWRGELDNGNVLSLDSNHIFDKVGKHRKELKLLGYNVTTLDSYNEAMKMYAISQDLQMTNISDIATKIKMDLAKFGFSSLKYGNHDTSISI